MSVLKSHMKCELSTMSNKIDSLSEFVNTKIDNLNDQQKILETLWENNKFLQMELQAKNDIIKNLLDTQSAVAESLSHSKDLQNQLTSLEKQKVTDQSNKVSNTEIISIKITNKTINIKITGVTIIIKANTKLMMTLANKFRSNIWKQTNKRNKFVKNFMWVT